VLSIARAVFCIAVLVRFLWVTELTAGRVLTTVPAIFVAVAFSVYVLISGSRSPLGVALPFVSVTLDAVVCFMTLLPAALWPEFTYIPLLNKVDTMAILVVITASSFRLSPSAALGSGIINGALFALLMVLDRARPWGDIERGAVVLYAFLIAGVSALAALTAAHTRRLVRRAADKALEAELARRNLGLVLSEHHDLRTLLSSASLHADLLARELESTPAGDAVRRCGSLRRDLRLINDTVRQIREHSYLEILIEQRRSLVDVSSELQQVLREAERRFPKLSVQVARTAESAEAWIRGGAEALRRVLLNLIVNAAEGDGSAGASSVRVELDVRESALCIRVEDDGPGFPEAALEQGLQRLRTTKTDGLGFGLAFVRSVVERSGGRVACANRPSGGACVELSLPSAPSEAPESSHRTFVRPAHAL
jgi:signal transduction histidine kinase